MKEKIYKSKYKNYGVTKSGKIYSYITKRFLKGKRDKDGYIEYVLSVDNKSKYVRGHRVVLEAFCPNIYDKPTVNHKNSIKNDNRLQNLEWATFSENNLHRMSYQHNRLANKNTIKYEVIGNNKCRVVSQSELNKISSRQYVECIDNNIINFRYIVLKKLGDNKISEIFNGEIINIYNSRNEIAQNYNKRPNTISSKIHQKLTKVQQFSLNYKVKRLSD